jgi:hypothetical protein
MAVKRGPMLTEKAVVTAVCAELKTRGYHIKQALGPKQHGDDIIATKPGPVPVKLIVEAKGETSSQPGTSRYGKPFDSRQVRAHVSRAFYRAAAALSRRDEVFEVRAGMALPDNQRHRDAIEEIQPVLTQLQLLVFWVQQDRTVQVCPDRGV